MDDEGVGRVLDLDAVVCPEERAEAVRARVAFRGERGYVAAERVVRVGVAFSVDKIVSVSHEYWSSKTLTYLEYWDAHTPLGGPSSRPPGPVVNSKSMLPALIEMLEIASLSTRLVFQLERGKPAMAFSKAVVMERGIFLRAMFQRRDWIDTWSC